MIPDRITPVILCGGVGARLWPRSRAGAPKPFLPLVGSLTLFQETLARCRDAGFARPMIVAGAAHVELVDSQVSGFEFAEIVVEPQSRQTAAAVAVAALRLPPEAVMLVCPSDHHIGDNAAFANACSQAADLAARGSLVCLGVPAAAAETRFGYIRAGEPLGPAEFQVAQFVEKPDAATAAHYLGSGRFVWNAGIFAFRAGDYLAELQKYRPALAAAARESLARGCKRDSHYELDAAAFATIEPESVDFAVMENTERAAMVLAHMDWSDVGDWKSLKRMRPQDERGNTVRGPGEAVDCRNILVDSDGPRVRAIGLEDVIIVVDGDDILVAAADRLGDFATLVEGDNRR